MNDLATVTFTKIQYYFYFEVKYIMSCLFNPDNSIMMMEADVVMGRIYGENDTVPKRPVMAHPPDIYSDITLEQFIQSILEVFFIFISCWKLGCRNFKMSISRT